MWREFGDCYNCASLTEYAEYMEMTVEEAQAKKQGLMMLHHHWLATPELERATALAVAEGIARLPPNCTTLDVEFVKARRHQLATHIPTGLAPGTELQQQQQQQQRRGSGSSSNASSSARAASNVRGGRKRGQMRQ